MLNLSRHTLVGENAIPQRPTAAEGVEAIERGMEAMELGMKDLAAFLWTHPAITAIVAAYFPEIDTWVAAFSVFECPFLGQASDFYFLGFRNAPTNRAVFFPRGENSPASLKVRSRELS